MAEITTVSTPISGLVSNVTGTVQDVATLAGAGVGVPTTAEFFDYFFGDNGGMPAQNFNMFLQWNVTGGSVDFVGGVGPGVFGAPPEQPNGRYVDLGGSTASPGLFETKLAYPVVAGQSYTFAFDYRSTEGDANRATATVAGRSYAVSTSNTSFQHFSVTFVADTTALVKIAFQGDRQDTDNSGVGIDGVLFGPQLGLTTPLNPVTGAGASGSGTSTAAGGATTVSASQAIGFATQFSNVARVDVSSADATPSTLTAASGARFSNPLYAQFLTQQTIASQLDAGQVSTTAAQTALLHLVDGTTSAANIAYAFFTGLTPTSAGLNYLVHSSANGSDLNDAYYSALNVDNRYINLAVGLATGAGEGAIRFAASYGSLSLESATAKAYTQVFGVAPSADKVAAILNAPVPNGLGGTETRAQYFTDLGGSPQGAKAAMIGFLLADSVKEETGVYQAANQHFLQDLAHGTASFHVDLLTTYGPAVTLTGGAQADATVPH